MSATVDFRTRTSSEMNTGKGQNPSPFIFDFISFSANQCPKNMNSPLSPSLSISESAKPSSGTAPLPENLGKNYTVQPRRVKHRRHFVSHRGKPRVSNSSDGKIDVGLSPFRSKQPDYLNPEDAGKKSERLPDPSRSRNPSEWKPKSTGVRFSFDSIKEEDFVFGSNHVNDSSENSNSRSGFMDNGARRRTSQNVKDAAFNFKFGVRENLNSNLSSSSNSGLGGITGTVSPNETRRPKIITGMVDISSGSSTVKECFVFGTNRGSDSYDDPNSSSGSDRSVQPSEARNLKITSGVGDKSGGSNTCSSQNAKNDAFTFKLFERGNLGLNSNSSFGGIPGLILPDATRQLKVASGEGYIGCSDSTSQSAKGAAFNSKFSERGISNLNPNGGLGGIAGSLLPDEKQKRNEGNRCTLQNTEDPAFSFSFGKRGNSNSNLSSGSGGIAESMMADEVVQLEIGSRIGDNKGNNYTLQNAEDAGLTSKFGARGSWVSGGAFEGHLFVFGDNEKRNPASKGNSGGGVCDNNVSMLPDEARKLKIGSTFKDSSSGASSDNFSGSGKQSVSQLNSRDYDTADNISFLKDKDATFNSTTGKSVTLDTCDIPEKNAFLFGSNMEKSPDLKDSTSFLGMESRLPDETGKLNIGSRGRDSGGRRQKATSGTHIRSTRLNGLRNIRSAQAAGSFFSTPGKMEKGFSSSRSTSKEMEPKNSEAKITPNLAEDAPIPTTFTFQAANLVDGLTVDSGPSLEPTCDSKPNISVGQSSLASSSVGQGFHSTSAFSVEFPVEKVGNKTAFSFGSTRDGSGSMDSEIPKQVSPSLQKEHVFLTPGVEPFAVLHQNLEFSAKEGAVKSAKAKKRRGRARQSASVNQRGGQNSVLKEKNLPENSELDSPGSCSPMDISPYRETLPGDECSRGTSMVSNDSVHLGASHISLCSQQSVPVESRGGGPLHREESYEEGSEHWFKGSSVRPGCSLFDNEHCDPKTGKTGSKDETETEVDFSDLKIEKPEIDGGEKLSFSLKSEDLNETNFTSAASPYTQGLPSRGRHHYKKKHHLKVGQDEGSFTPTTKPHSVSPLSQLFPLASTSLQQGPVQVEPGTEADKKNDTFVDKRPTVEKEFMSAAEYTIPVPCSAPPARAINSTMASTPKASVTAAALEACEKWRLRGNQAYSAGDLSRAEGYYTRGVNSIPPSVTSSSCIKAIMLCYSNRAATRMSLGRVREALVDCMKAAAMDPCFLRVQVRAANCHLALGEIEDAFKQFKKCMQSENNQSSDKKIIADASDGLRQAQLVAEYVDQCAELLRSMTSDDANSALHIITRALSISPYSEQLIEMKAETLIMLHKYEEVIQLCEQTQDSAETNSSSISNDIQLGNDDSASKMSSATRVWRCRLISKAYFQLGRLEEALDLLKKHEQMDPLVEKNGSRIPDSLGALVVTVRELLCHKAAGNEAFQVGRHLEAVEHYTAALTCNAESRPFSAICFCNRAAAYQALGQITDAIADCSLAIALDSKYPKAISRRATLHEIIRDYGQAQNDLQQLVSLLEKQIESNANQSGILPRSVSNKNDLKQARLRLAVVVEETRKEIPLDMYLILGIEPACSASDVKKAYRKAALRHHPDKAGQFLARNDNGDDRLWKEIAIKFHKDADRLFKMIGEAYAIISDPIKRSQYDMEEDARNIRKKGTGSSPSQTSAHVRSHPFHGSRGGSRRQWQETSRTYAAQYHRWSDTNRYS